jgi:hypothetical protein
MVMVFLPKNVCRRRLPEQFTCPANWHEKGGLAASPCCPASIRSDTEEIFRMNIFLVNLNIIDLCSSGRSGQSEDTADAQQSSPHKSAWISRKDHRRENGEHPD